MEKYIVAVSENDAQKFEKKCDELIEQGYKVQSTSCGFVNHTEYNFCDVWQAIFIKKECCK